MSPHNTSKNPEASNKKTTKKRKKLLPFAHLKHQVSFMFISLLLLSVFSISMINGLFLERYYISKKIDVLLEAKLTLEQLDLEDLVEEDDTVFTDGSRRPKEEAEEDDGVPDEVEKNSSRNNFSWVVIDQANSGYFPKGDPQRMLRNKLFGYINSLDMDVSGSRVLKSTDDCMIWKIHDRFSDMNYV